MKADVDCWLYANTLVRQEHFLRNSRARPFLYFYVTGTSACSPASNQRQTGSQLGSPLGSSFDESLVVGLGADSYLDLFNCYTFDNAKVDNAALLGLDWPDASKSVWQACKLRSESCNLPENPGNENWEPSEAHCHGGELSPHTEPQESILLALEAEVKGTCSPLKIGLLLKGTVSKMEVKVSLSPDPLPGSSDVHVLDVIFLLNPHIYSISTSY